MSINSAETVELLLFRMDRRKWNYSLPLSDMSYFLKLKLIISRSILSSPYFCITLPAASSGPEIILDCLLNMFDYFLYPSFPKIAGGIPPTFCTEDCCLSNSLDSFVGLGAFFILHTISQASTNPYNSIFYSTQTYFSFKRALSVFFIDISILYFKSPELVAVVPKKLQ